jgi:O-antigen/teichoic acid export membrane protein
LGLGLTATKYVAEFREKDPAKAGRIIALSNRVAVASGGLMTLGLLITAPWLATHTLAAPHLSGLLQAGALLLLLGAVNGAQTGALSGFEAFRTIANVNLWAGIAAFPLMVGGAKLAGLNGALWGLVASTAINWVLNHLALKREVARAGVPLALSGCRQEFPILWNYSFPALLGSIVVGPVTWACNAVLVNQPNGYAEMGVFNAANQWFNALMFLPGVLGQAVLPMLSERLGYDDKVRSNRILTSSIKLNAVVVFPMVLMGCLFSPFIMSIYGAGFRDAWPTLAVALLTAGLLAVQAPVGAVVQASGRMWLAASMNLGWGFAFFISTLLLVRYGSVGLSTARGIAYILHSLWVFLFAFSLIRSSQQEQRT